MPRKLLITAVVVICSLGAWASTEVVSNGGFETGSLGSDWTTQCFGTCTVSVVGGGVSDPVHPSHSGTYSLQAIGAAGITQTFPSYDGISPGVFAGLVTDAHLWFNSNASLFAVELLYSGVTPQLCDPSTGFLCIDVAIQGWTDYGQQLLGNLQTAGSGRFLNGIVIATLDNSTNYLDDVSIMANASFNPQPTPEPTTLLLIGSGVATLAGRRPHPRLWRN